MSHTKHKINIANAVIGSLLFMFLPIFFGYWYDRFMPVEKIFYYETIRPAQQVFPVGSKPRLYSDALFKKPVPIEWVDVLRCSGFDEKGFTFFSSYTSETGQAIVNTEGDDYKSGGWVYHGDTPNVPVTCIIDSTITARLDYGVTKTQSLQSEEFSFGYVDR